MILNQIASGGGGTPAEFAPLRFIASPTQVTVTADGTPHTKGAWTELIASTAADSTWAVVCLYGLGTSGVNTASLIDFALGAAGSEVAFVENIAVGGADGAASQTYTFPLPYAIPAGSRVSARIQSIVSAQTAIVDIGLFSGGNHTPATTALTVMGTSTATSAGVRLSDSWTEIEDSTPATFRYFVAVPSLSTDSSANSSNLVSVGAGAAGVETLYGVMQVYTSSTENVMSSVHGPSLDSQDVFTGAAAGTRLVGKRDGSIFCDLCIIGIP